MLSEVEMRQQNYAGAISFLRCVVAMANKLYGPEDAQTAKYMDHLNEAQAAL
jgi:hypothetical protein